MSPKTKQPLSRQAGRAKREPEYEDTTSVDIRSSAVDTTKELGSSSLNEVRYPCLHHGNVN